MAYLQNFALPIKNNYTYCDKRQAGGWIIAISVIISSCLYTCRREKREQRERFFSYLFFFNSDNNISLVCGFHVTNIVFGCIISFRGSHVLFRYPIYKPSPSCIRITILRHMCEVFFISSLIPVILLCTQQNMLK